MLLLEIQPESHSTKYASGVEQQRVWRLEGTSCTTYQGREGPAMWM